MATRQIGITPQKLTAWLERRTGGRAAREIAKDRGLHVRTVEKYVNEIDAFIKQSPEYKDALKRVVQMIPAACEVYEHAMSEKGRANSLNEAVRCATNVFKIASLLRDRPQVEDTGYAAITDAELLEMREKTKVKLAEMAREELAQEALENGLEVVSGGFNSENPTPVGGDGTPGEGEKEPDASA